MVNTIALPFSNPTKNDWTIMPTKPENGTSSAIGQITWPIWMSESSGGLDGMAQATIFFL